jgi:hypothetical protein
MTPQIIILLMGVYMVGGALTMLLSPERLQAMVESIGDQPAVSYVSGAIMAPLGAAVLASFHDFSNLPRAIATIIGAGLLLEGWLLMATPKTLLSLARPFFMAETATRLMGAGVMAAAIAAIWYGLSG